VERDPVAETPIVCAKCGMAEVIPSLSENPLARPEKAAVPTVQVRCPQCKSRFTAVRNLFGPTAITCPTCGRRTRSWPPGEGQREGPDGRRLTKRGI